MAVSPGIQNSQEWTADGKRDLGGRQTVELGKVVAVVKFAMVQNGCMEEPGIAGLKNLQKSSDYTPRTQTAEE